MVGFYQALTFAFYLTSQSTVNLFVRQIKWRNEDQEKETIMQKDKQTKKQMEVSPVVSRVLTGVALAREAQSNKSP